MGQAQKLERAFQKLHAFDDGMEVEVQEEEQEEEEEEGMSYRWALSNKDPTWEEWKDRFACFDDKRKSLRVKPPIDVWRKEQSVKTETRRKFKRVVDAFKAAGSKKMKTSQQQEEEVQQQQ